jgi:4-diphosphocytidyl-2-C-methyl-D-erythritol kinase
MIQLSNCKINLGLHITAKRPDGFHNVETCFYPIPLYDVLEVVPANEFAFYATGLPIDGSTANNLCVKAVQLLASDYPQILQSALYLLKNIPMGAGVGGGSANATHTLILYNKKFNLGLTQEKLLQYSAQLGSDCSFFVYNTPCFAKGKGELLKPSELNLKGFVLVVVFSDLHVSTKEAFEGCKINATSPSIQEVISKPITQWKHLLQNDFEETVFTKHPSLAATKNEMYKLGAIYASMSGSGSSVYGLFTANHIGLAEINNVFPKSHCHSLEL